jgi:hypothetical protein
MSAKIYFSGDSGENESLEEHFLLIGLELYPIINEIQLVVWSPRPAAYIGDQQAQFLADAENLDSRKHRQFMYI